MRSIACGPEHRNSQSNPDRTDCSAQGGSRMIPALQGSNEITFGDASEAVLKAKSTWASFSLILASALQARILPYFAAAVIAEVVPVASGDGGERSTMEGAGRSGGGSVLNCGKRRVLPKVAVFRYHGLP